VQAGMRSAGYRGLWLSDQERRLRHFHKTITDYVSPSVCAETERSVDQGGGRG